MPISNNLPPINPSNPLPAPTGEKPNTAIAKSRSGQNTPNSDTFHASLKSTIDQAKAFLTTASATETPQTLETQFLASMLSPHLKEGKNIDGTIKTDAQALAAFKTMNEKLVTYLQADDLQGAFTLLNGTHAPVENEFKGKYNPLKWMQNKMQAVMQEQPKHQTLPPELASFEAFKQHLNTLRQQFHLCLGKVETPKGGAIIPRTAEAIANAKATATQQLEKVTGKIAVTELLSDEILLGEAIVHNLKTSSESREMLVRTWFQQLIDTTQKTTDAEGKSLLENPKVQRYLQGLLLSIGGETATEGQVTLKAAIVSLLPESNAPSILAPVPQKIMAGAITLKDNALAIAQFNQGLPEELLKLLPDEFHSVNAFKSALEAFQASLQTITAGTLGFAKSQVVSEEAKAGLIEAYQLALQQQAHRLKQQLGTLNQPAPTVKLPAFLNGLPEAQQHRVQNFLVNATQLPPVEKAKQVKQLLSEIPQDMRKTFQRFIASEQKRLEAMKAIGASAVEGSSKISKNLVALVDEVYNPDAVEEQITTFNTAMGKAIQAEIIKPLQETTRKVMQGGIATPTGTTNELKPIATEGVSFAKPLAVVKEAGEAAAKKSNWFSAWVDHNKEILPWAGLGTAGLALVTGIGLWLSKNKKTIEAEK